MFESYALINLILHTFLILQTPFRNLSLILSVLSLLEILGKDPKIKRTIHDLKHFPNAPSTTTLHYNTLAGGTNKGGQKRVLRAVVHAAIQKNLQVERPLCFFVFGLLLYGPISFMLVPSSSSVTGKAAAVVPLYHTIAKVLASLCRFDQRNKIAISSAVTPMLINLLKETKSRSLLQSLLECIRSILSELVNLSQSDQDFLCSADVEKTLDALAEGEFASLVQQIKELIQ